MSATTPRVVLVDDHGLFRSGVRAELGRQVEVVGEADDVQPAIDLIGELLPDVVLLDVHLPGGGGQAVVQAVKASHPEVRFLALSASDAPEDVIAVIRAGARGYVTKTISTAELADWASPVTVEAASAAVSLTASARCCADSLSSWAACWPAWPSCSATGRPCSAAKSLTWVATCCSGSVAGSSEERSQPAPKAISPAASGFPWVPRRAVSGAERTVSTAEEAVPATVSRAAEALAPTLSPTPEVAEPAVW